MNSASQMCVLGGAVTSNSACNSAFGNLQRDPSIIGDEQRPACVLGPDSEELDEGSLPMVSYLEHPVL